MNAGSFGSFKKDMLTTYQEGVSPRPEDLAISGNRTVLLELVLEHHMQDMSGYLGTEVDFIGYEHAHATAENARREEYLHMQRVNILRRYKFYERDGLEQFVFEQFMFEQFAQMTLRQLRDGLGKEVFITGKGVPIVFFERWEDEGKAAGYKRIAEMSTLASNNSLDRILRGEFSDAYNLTYIHLALTAIGIEARNREMARNISRLDEILGMHYFGLQGKPELHGIGFVGAMHYGVLDLIQNAQNATGNVKIALHPSSPGPDEVRSVSYLSEALAVIGKNVEPTSDIGHAEAQLEGYVEAQLDTLFDTFQQISEVIWGACAEGLIRLLLPKFTSGLLNSDMLGPLRVGHHIAERLSPDNIMELSRRIGKEWYNGQKPPLSGNQMKRLKNVVNGFLSEMGAPTIPTTARELDYFVKTYVA
ncbi:hypothetical protein HYY73_05755 [Candidatus Woesearchaeota archaeon]|nr:hypothetical protein [Candidatus Woesearchaeota archaeon]